jgi:hypothetical protein
VFEQLKEAAQEIASDRATDAAVAHFDDFLIRGNQQMVVDPNLPEFIDDYGYAAAMFGSQNTVEQRRLTRAQKTRQYGNRNSRIVGAHVLSVPFEIIE